MPRKKATTTDNWRDQSTHCCATCMAWVEKANDLGRCRRNAPTLDGWPATFASDWCYQHKLDAEAL